MEKQLFKGLPPRDVIDALEANCDKIERDYSYMKQYTPEEILAFKEELSSSMIKLNILETEFDEVKRDFKEKMDPIKKELNFNLAAIRDKSTLVKEDVFIFKDDSEMGIYTRDGILVSSRPLMEHEKQKTIFSVLREERKEGTND